METKRVAGQVFGKYRIVRKIASGGMGDIYLAEHTALGREVVLKILPREYTRDSEYRARFQREAQSVAKLEHPNIIQIFDVGEKEGRMFMALQYIEGKSLAQILGERGKLEIEEACRIASQVAKGLKHAHDNGIVHRDIKPDNILVGATGDVKITDFGVALDTESQTRLTAAGRLVGTPHYISPEQAQGRKADHRSDLYALGVMLYLMLTGRRPFTGENSMAVLHKHIYSKPVPPRKFNKNISPALNELVLKLLSKKPTDRYQDALELARALERCAANVRRVVRQHNRITAPLQPVQQAPNKAPYIIGAGVAATFLVLLSIMVFGKKSEPPKTEPARRVTPHATTAKEPENVPTPQPAPPQPKSRKPDPQPEQDLARKELEIFANVLNVKAAPKRAERDYGAVLRMLQEIDKSIVSPGPREAYERAVEGFIAAARVMKSARAAFAVDATVTVATRAGPVSGRIKDVGDEALAIGSQKISWGDLDTLEIARRSRASGKELGLFFLYDGRPELAVRELKQDWKANELHLWDALGIAATLATSLDFKSAATLLTNLESQLAEVLLDSELIRRKLRAAKDAFGERVVRQLERLRDQPGRVLDIINTVSEALADSSHAPRLDELKHQARRITASDELEEAKRQLAAGNPRRAKALLHRLIDQYEKTAVGRDAVQMMHRIVGAEKWQTYFKGDADDFMHSDKASGRVSVQSGILVIDTPSGSELVTLWLKDVPPESILGIRMRFRVTKKLGRNPNVVLLVSEDEKDSRRLWLGDHAVLLTTYRGGRFHNEHQVAVSRPFEEWHTFTVFHDGARCFLFFDDTFLGIRSADEWDFAPRTAIGAGAVRVEISSVELLRK